MVQDRDSAANYTKEEILKIQMTNPINFKNKFCEVRYERIENNF